MDVLSLTASAQSTGLFVALIAVLLYAGYLQLLPKPIPGIPYHKDAVRSLLGDIPRFQRENPKNLGAWMTRQIQALDSPIVQLFVRPFGPPFVFISDFREAQDVLARRKEFDRSDFDIELLGGLGDHSLIAYKTNATWKTHRRLLLNLMSPEFLHNVAAPNIYQGALQLLKLWTIKLEISNGKAFTVEEDIYYAALDALYDFTFGDAAKHRALTPQIDCLEALGKGEIETLRAASAQSAAFKMPSKPIHESLEAFIKALDPAPLVAATGRPKLAWKIAQLFPTIRKWKAVRHAFLKDQVHVAVDRLRQGGTSSSHTKNAVDQILQQERAFAEKEGREPVYWSPVMRDEVSWHYIFHSSVALHASNDKARTADRS